MCGSGWKCGAVYSKVSSVEVKIVLIRGNVYRDFPIRRFEFVYLLTQKVEGCVSLSLLFFFFLILYPSISPKNHSCDFFG